MWKIHRYLFHFVRKRMIYMLYTDVIRTVNARHCEWVVEIIWAFDVKNSKYDEISLRRCAMTVFNGFHSNEMQTRFSFWNYMLPTTFKDLILSEAVWFVLFRASKREKNRLNVSSGNKSCVFHPLKVKMHLSLASDYESNEAQFSHFTKRIIVSMRRSEKPII